jgi:hypothetical protein
MWQYHISGGSGVQLTKRKKQQDVNEPVISPDGKKYIDIMRKFLLVVI